MRTNDLNRYALSSCVFVATLAGCGGSQSPIGVPGAMAQSRAIAQHAARGKSWMLPEANGEDLIYAPGGCGGETCVLSYPKGKVVGVISWVGSPITGSGACSDPSGNVFISNNNEMAEYAHGGTTPIATLSLPGNNAFGCSIDPATGNLAVVFSSRNGDLAIFPHAQGTPITYSSHLESFYCGYDNAGNLYVNGYSNGVRGFSEMTSGSGTFNKLSIDDSVGTPGQVQWDGSYITWQSIEENHPKISRLSISGSTATVVSTTTLSGIGRRAMPTWIYGGKVVVPYSDHGAFATFIGIWPYPAGGAPTKRIRKLKGYPKNQRSFLAATISVAPSR